MKNRDLGAGKPVSRVTPTSTLDNKGKDITGDKDLGHPSSSYYRKLFSLEDGDDTS